MQAIGTRALNRFQRQEIRVVLDDIEALINVDFIEVDYEPNAAAAQLHTEPTTLSAAETSKSRPTQATTMALEKLEAIFSLTPVTLIPPTSPPSVMEVHSDWRLSRASKSL